MNTPESILKSEEFLKEGVGYFKQMRLENTAHMTSGLSTRLEKTNERIESLEKSIVSADRSSTRLSTSLNRLTLALAVIAFLALAWDVFKWNRGPNQPPETMSTAVTPAAGQPARHP